MKEFLHKCITKLNANRRDLVIFLLALLLAFSIWLIHNLSLSYTEVVTVPVTAKCNIDHCLDISKNTCNISARATMTGYRIISLNSILRRNRQPRVIDFDRTDMHHDGGEVWYVTSKELKEYAHLIYGEDVKVDYFLSDTLKFRFAEQAYRRVPVVPVRVLTFGSQYMMSYKFQIEPDSVTIYGDPEHLARIEGVSTEPIKRYDIDASFHGKASLKKIKGIRFSDEVVYYSANVTRYIEIDAVLPVYARNVPADKEFKYYPASVKASFKCGFPVSSSPASEVVLYLDYNDYVTSLSGKCPVYVEGLSNEILDYNLEFNMLGCFANDKLR